MPPIMSFNKNKKLKNNNATTFSSVVISLIVIQLFFSIRTFASTAIIELLGTSHSAIYPNENSIYSKAIYCHNAICHNALLEVNRALFGDFLPSGQYSDVGDEVTVLSKIFKITKLLSSTRQNHMGEEAGVYYALESIFGTAEDLSPTTISGCLNKMIQDLSEASPDIGNIVLKSIGSTSDGIGTGSLIEMLNLAIYTLSTKPIVEGTLAQLANAVEQIPISNELLTINLNYFKRVAETLTYASLFFDDADILSVKRVIGSQEDDGQTIQGFVNAIIELTSSASPDFDEQLESLLKVSSYPESLFGCLNTVVSIVNTKLIDLLKINKLREAITQFFDQQVSSSESELYKKLIIKIDEVATDLYPIVKKVGARSLEAQAPSCTKCTAQFEYRSDEATNFLRLGMQRANLTTDQADDRFLSEFDCKSTIIAGMNINKISFDIFNRSNNFSRFINLIGDSFPSLDDNTLSSYVAKLVNGFYLHPIRQSVAANVQSELMLIDKCISTADDSFATLKNSPYLGNMSFVEFENPNTLSKKIQLLQSALERGFITTDRSIALRLFNAIGIHSDQQNSILNELRKLRIAIQLSNVENLPASMDLSKQIIERAKTIVDELLVLLHRGVFFDYFRTVEAGLKNASKKHGQLSFDSGLDSVLQKSRFFELAPFFSNYSYTLPPKSIVDFSGIMGTLFGQSSQTSLAGNMLALTTSVRSDLEYVKRCVGKPIDIRESPYIPSPNTLYGNINWMILQLEQNRVCSCLHTGTLLRSLSNDIAIFCNALEYFGNALNVIIANNPTMDSTDCALTFIQNAVNAVYTHINTILSKKSQMFDQSQCQAYRIDEQLQSLRNVVNALTNYIQKLLPEEFPEQEIVLSVASNPEYFYESIDDIVQRINVLSSKFSEFTTHLLNVKILPVSSRVPQSIEFIQQLLIHIANTLNDMVGTEALAFHLNEDKGLALSNLSDSVTEIHESIGALNELSSLCNSHIAFLGNNIYRLITELSGAIATVFNDDQIEIDSFVRNRRLEQYFNVFAQMAKRIARALPIENHNRRGKIRQVNDENVYLENALTTITNILFGGIKVFAKLAEELMSKSVTILPKYLMENDVQYRNVFSPCPSIDELAQSLADYLLPIARHSETLSYSLPIIGALNTFIGCVAEIQSNAAKIISLGDSNLPVSLTSLGNVLNSILDEFQNPRCCAPLLHVISEIKHTMGNATELFLSLIDVIFSPDATAIDPAALSGSFAKMGAGIRLVAENISHLSQRIRTTQTDFAQKLCFSDDIISDVIAVSESMHVMRDSLAEALPYLLNDDNLSEDIKNESDELYEIARMAGCWSQKLHELADNVKNKLMAELYSTDFSSDLSNSSFSQILAIFKATPYLAPFFTSIVSSLNKLCDSLNPGGGICKHFCSHGSKNLTPSITLIAQNIGKIVNEIQLLIDMSEPIRAITFAQATKQVIIQQAHEHCLLGTKKGEDNVVFYQSTEFSNLFLLRNSENFIFNNATVSFDSDGTISAPNELIGQKMSDVMPISLFKIVKQDVDLFQKIKERSIAYKHPLQYRRVK
ncbi:MAG: hypothetical protein LBJ89_01975 [Holosporales bacterium]|jgi:uncharacterized protein YoxC|nr:hypothetical protein [Holosporales bacterium]